MKYVMLGTLNAEWAGRQGERVDKARKKLADLGMKLESLHYTQGPFDFVDIVEAPDAEAMLAFLVWYAREGLGRIVTMPAFGEAEFEKALKKS